MLAGEYSINAKLLYGLLLNRTMLSQKSGWVSEDGNVYVIYTIKQMANDLDRSERTVKTALRELENAGLITRVRQGWQTASFCKSRTGCRFLPVQRAISVQWMCRILPLAWGKNCLQVILIQNIKNIVRLKE